MTAREFSSELPDFAGLLVLIVLLVALWNWGTPAFVGGLQ